MELNNQWEDEQERRLAEEERQRRVAEWHATIKSLECTGSRVENFITPFAEIIGHRHK